jgi:hypothetical protein
MSRARSRWTPLDLLLLGVLPLTAMGWWFYVFGSRHAVALDFQHSFLGAADAIVNGRTPFPTGTALGHLPYYYPPLTAVLAVPFLSVPTIVAAWGWTLVLVVSIPLSLWLLGVRDWRCLGAVLLWSPTFAALQTANLSIPLLLAAALIWRYRDGSAGWLSLGASIAAKLIFWPLLVWLVAIRRYRACAYAIGSAFALVLIPWAIIDFRGLAGYPALSRIVARDNGPKSYSLGALLERLLGTGGLAITVVVVVALLVAVFAAGWRKNARLAFTLALLAALVASPVVWLHYLVILAAVIAVYKPTFGPAWLAPLILWVCPGNEVTRSGAVWQIALVLGLSLSLIAWLNWRTPADKADAADSTPPNPIPVSWRRAKELTA